MCGAAQRELQRLEQLFVFLTDKGTDRRVAAQPWEVDSQHGPILAEDLGLLAPPCIKLWEEQVQLVLEQQRVAAEAQLQARLELVLRRGVDVRRHPAQRLECTEVGRAGVIAEGEDEVGASIGLQQNRMRIVRCKFGNKDETKSRLQDGGYHTTKYKPGDSRTPERLPNQAAMMRRWRPA